MALDLKGTANDFTNGSGIWTIGAIGGGGTLTTITGGNSNFNIAALAAAYMSAVSGTITLGNGANTFAANAGNWTITSGLVPGGTAGDSGNNVATLNPGLGNLHIVKTGGGADTFTIGNTGGRVDIASGAGNDLFLWNQAGIFRR
ncbi:MAG: hypothetical protein U1E60_01770 [Reyranellaceae bacterium]